MQMGVSCKACFEKDLEIKLLKEEVQKLKAQAKLYHQKAMTKGVYGSSTPSSKIPVKKNATAEMQNKRGGAKPGHKGHGRKKVTETEAERVISQPIAAPSHCPQCKEKLRNKGAIQRTVMDLTPIQLERVIYHLNRAYCSSCKKTYQGQPPGVSPRALYSHRLIVQAASLHYVHGVSLGKIVRLFGSQVYEGSLLNAFHQLAERLKEAIPQIQKDYLSEPVKHADETGWRTDGKSAYAWLFCSSQNSIYRFGQSRAAQTPLSIFGEKKVSGVLVVDRFGSYNRVPCKIQYCYAHLLRQAKGLGEDFQKNIEIQSFVTQVSTLLSKSMKLRSEPISDDQYYLRARQLEAEIRRQMSLEYKSDAVKRFQFIFQTKDHRLYHWVKDRRVPAENNQAEREIRTVVVARKLSFGSQSDQGASTRSIWMSYLFTAKKRLGLNKNSLENWLEETINQLQADPQISAYQLLPSISIH